MSVDGDLRSDPAFGGPLQWLRACWPAPTRVDWRERARVAGGAALGIALTALLCRWLGGSMPPAWPWLVAPLGASAVLVFAVPSSPLAQPWSVIGGNVLSALVGIACVRWLASPELAAGVAVGAAIVVMFAMRCLHPPGGAAALLVALGGVTDPWFALYPVLLNSLLLVATAIAYNHATGRSYPQAQLPPGAAAREPAAPSETLAADLAAVTARLNHVLDIGPDDLEALLRETQWRAYQRKLANIRCRDIMSRDLITVRDETPLQAAWPLFRQHRIKALPVVDSGGRLVGIVTPADFTRAAEAGRADAPAPGHPSRPSGARVPDEVGRIMTRQVRVAREDQHLAELVPMFGGTGHHHLPIVGDQGRLTGIVTQSDLVAALCGADAGSAGDVAQGAHGDAAAGLTRIG